MTTMRSDGSGTTAQSTQTMQRRGWLAAAWAAVIGLVLRNTSEPVQAAAGLQYADTTTPVTNTSKGPTVIVADDINYSGTGSVFTGQTIVASAMAGLQGVCGLRGPAPIRCGVLGHTGESAPSAGVYGNANSDTVGVLGRAESAGTGVLGQSVSGLPILGQVAPGSSANTIAIYGLNNSTFTGPGPGAGGFGVYGLSAKGHGLVGATAAAGAAAVVGATNGVAGAYAAAFYGRVIVGGDFTVVNGAKSAAVAHPDGTHRRLYCVESPESWFEDFGSGQLDGGCADIVIDPDFAAMVDLSSYHVFLTQYDAHHVLAVSDRTPNGFRVHANSPDGNGEFSWRVVARRRDIRSARLEPVTIPQEPTLPPVPNIAVTLSPTPQSPNP